MTKLGNMACIPCSEGGKPLTAEEIERFRQDIPDWEVVTESGVLHLRRTFMFPDFRQAIAFTNRIGELAEAEGHHPRLVTEWGKVTVEWWTHSVQGLHQNDFIMAARTDDPHNA